MVHNNTDISIKVDGSNITIPDVDWGWSVGTGTGQDGINYQTFKSVVLNGESATFPVWHFYFARKYPSELIDHLDACIDFTYPTEHSSKMYQWFYKGCKQN